MKGILYSQYKLVEKYLNKLHEENELHSTSIDDSLILQHKEKLKEIYKNYRTSFVQIKVLINEFEMNKESVRRLLILQKKSQRKKINVQKKASSAKCNK